MGTRGKDMGIENKYELFKEQINFNITKMQVIFKRGTKHII